MTRDEERKQQRRDGAEGARRRSLNDLNERRRRVGGWIRCRKRERERERERQRQKVGKTAGKETEEEESETAVRVW